MLKVIILCTCTTRKGSGLDSAFGTPTPKNPWCKTPGSGLSAPGIAGLYMVAEDWGKKGSKKKTAQKNCMDPFFCHGLVIYKRTVTMEINRKVL